MSEIIVDNFAGGGGASTGIEQAIGRSVDVAINHDPDAIAMHKVNHPSTKHYCEDVFDVDPKEVAAGRPVALCWLSPDCKHFSKAKGSTPVSKKIRGLAWVAIRWAATVKPRVIMLENVEEFRTWGPLVSTEKGLMPDPNKKGKTFENFTMALKRQGYHVEFKEMRACDYGAPTTRKRLFMIARRDGNPIIWPKATHGPRESDDVKSGKLLPYHSAAECIDWDLPGKSIFGRKKPLSENTLKRIARGLKKFVIDNPDPFILRICQSGFGKDKLVYPLDKPLTTITTKAEHCLVEPRFSAWIKKDYGNSTGNDITSPLSTITSQSNHHSLMTAHLSVNNTGHSGSDIDSPVTTITTGGHQMLVSSFLSKYFGGNYKGAGIDMREPTDTITSVDHHSRVDVAMTKDQVDRSPEVQLFFEEYMGEAAFLTKYYGQSDGQDITGPIHTIPTKDRFGLVRVKNQDYRITDITLRMLQPHELAKAQGVPDDYILDRDRDGNKIAKDKQVARIGNMVVPNCAEALVRANLPELCPRYGQLDLFEICG